MDREYPDRPLVGVGAVIIEGGKVLLVKRGREPGYGQWSIPGGLVEAGETLQEAVAREVLEETGLHVEPGPLLEVFDRIVRDGNGSVRYHYVLIDYLCFYKGGEAFPSSDVSEIKFLTLQELDVLRDFTAGTKELIERAFGWLEERPDRSDA